MRFQNLMLRACVAVAIVASTTVLAADAPAAAQAAGPVTAIKAGRLVDVAAGRVRNEQVVLVQDGKITAVGPARTSPATRGRPHTMATASRCRARH
jgi:imidazolonepropionase-like amidohydrolase